MRTVLAAAETVDDTIGGTVLLHLADHAIERASACGPPYTGLFQIRSRRRQQQGRVAFPVRDFGDTPAFLKRP